MLGIDGLEVMCCIWWFKMDGWLLVVVFMVNVMVEDCEVCLVVGM